MTPRERFECWFFSAGMGGDDDLARDDGSLAIYTWSETRCMWEAYQAAWAERKALDNDLCGDLGRAFQREGLHDKADGAFDCAAEIRSQP